MHHFLSMLFSLLAIIGPVSGESELKVPNGGVWGSWATSYTKCPSGKYAAGFNMKIERMQLAGDDTGLNSIQLCCVDRSKGFTGSCDTPIESKAGRCSGGDELWSTFPSRVGDWGNWGDWSPTCPGKGICGLKTRVEDPQGSGDDTALNDVIMLCCD
ncbi:hypothetical protein F2P79_024245 [Pimephales promelas]|nr:hypothetical protein F2P79_024245 [Pimephales promelas]